MKRLLLIAPLLAIACGDSPDPGDTPTPTAAVTPTETPTPTATADPASREHCGEITEDEVWTAGSPHFITCSVTITTGSVTIEPDVSVLVDGGGLYLTVQGGELTIQGAESSPVTFSPSGDNQWYGIGVGPDAGDVRLSHTTITEAIQQGGTTNLGFGGLVVSGNDVFIDHLSVDGGTDCGVVLKDGGGFTDDSQALMVSNVEEYPVCAEPIGAGTLPGAAKGSTFSNNGDNVVLVINSAGLDTSSSWSDVGLPYYIGGPLKVEGTLASPAVLTLEAGVDLSFDGPGYLQFGRYANNNLAGFVTQGTEAEPVTLTGFAGVSRGSWGGIFAYGATEFSLSHTLLENGGSANNGAMIVHERGPLVNHVTITGSAGLGFSLIDGAAFEDGSSHLTITNSQQVGVVYGDAVASIPEEGSDYSGNDEPFVSIEGQGGPVRMTESGTWGDIGVDYKIAGRMDLEGTASNPTILTLEPGVEVSFADGTYLGIGGIGAAGLYAVGTEEAPIVFKSSDSFTAGSWGAIYFSEDTMTSETTLSHVDIGYAGNDQFYRRQGAIIVDSATINIGDAYIHDSECNGISIYGTGSVTMMDGERTYENVGCTNVYDENEPQAGRVKL